MSIKSANKKKLAGTFAAAVVLVLAVAGGIQALADSPLIIPAESDLSAEESLANAECVTLSDLKSIKELKENIYNNMLNSVDYYNSVEGEFVTTFLDPSYETTVTYGTSITDQLSYQAVASEITNMSVLYLNEKQYTSFNDSNIYYCDEFFSQLNSEHISIKSNICVSQSVARSTDMEEEIRAEPADDGAMAYYYRADITNAHYATTSIFSQELVFGFLYEKGNWDVTGVEDYLGRQALVIKGKVTDEYYSSKLSVTTFEMRVDVKTGILLDFQGYAGNGELTQYIKTNHIKVDAASNIKEQVQKEIAVLQSDFVLQSR